MKKFELNVDDLAVTSFSPVQVSGGSRGTVRANEAPPTYDINCNQETYKNTCYNYTCINMTCQHVEC